MNFIPDDRQRAELPDIPFFENITAEQIPGCRTHKTVEELQAEVRAVLKRMDCGNVNFMSGKTSEKPLRYGYQILFTYMGNKGRIDCVALPIRSETPVKKRQALAQALYLVRNALEAQLYAKYYQPGYEPIVPYLIDSKGVTMMQTLVERALPMLADGR